MSKEVFGDEGSAPSRGEDAAMYQDLLVLRERWSMWLHRFRKDLPGPDEQTQAALVTDALDEMVEALSGPL